MSGARNETELRDMLLRAYSEESGAPRSLPTTEVSQSKQDSRATLIEEEIEAQVRATVIDALLEALGWRIAGRPRPDDESVTMGVEVGVESVGEGTRRRMDYLGIESPVASPLMVVEAKRRSDRLPGEERDRPANGPEVARTFALYLSQKRRAGGRRPQRPELQLALAWAEILDDVCDYVQSCAAASGMPRVVMLTNGGWIVAFVDVANAFGNDGDVQVDAANIHVYVSPDACLESAGRLLEECGFHRLRRSVEMIALPLLIGRVAGRQVRWMMHGLQVAQAPGLVIQSPARSSVVVVPVVFLGDSTGAMVIVRGNAKEDELPGMNEREVREHLARVRAAAETLKAEVERTLNVGVIPVRTIAEHYRTAEAFARHPGVAVRGRTVDDHASRAIVATGADTHFVVENDPFRDCPGHGETSETRRASAVPPIGETLGARPRAVFPYGSKFTCHHSDIDTVRREGMSRAVLDSCGNRRSGGVNAAFCEVFPLEARLCCQCCCFREPCSAEEVLRPVVEGSCHRTQLTVEGAVV